MPEKKPERAPYKLSRESFKRIYTLHETQPWTAKKQAQLFALIEECRSLEEQNLILDLLNAYENFDEERSAEAFSSIYHQIENVWGLSSEQTLVVALHNEDEVGSGPALLQAIKPHFQQGSWKGQLIAHMKPALKILKTSMSVVFVDDFVGTGGQFCKAFEWFSNELQDKGISPKQIYLTSLCIMDQAVPIIEGKGVIHYAAHYMKKGITGRMDKARAENAKQLMFELEDRLKWRSDTQKERYSLGFMQSEALFRYMNNNAPNNNFPIFWWKETSDGRQRDTIQMRF